MTQPPADQPPRHPGYGPNPGAATPPGYAPGPPAGYAPPAAAAPGATQFGPGRPGRNPLGLVSLILGAVPSLLGVLFLLIQAAVITTGDPSAFGAIGTVNSVLSGLLGLAAVIVGIAALTRRGASKTLAAAGIALGAAALVSVLGGLLYGIVLNVMYGY